MQVDQFYIKELDVQSNLRVAASLRDSHILHNMFPVPYAEFGLMVSPQDITNYQLKSRERLAYEARGTQGIIVAFPHGATVRSEMMKPDSAILNVVDELGEAEYFAALPLAIHCLILGLESILKRPIVLIGVPGSDDDSRETLDDFWMRVPKDPLRRTDLFEGYLYEIDRLHRDKETIFEFATTHVRDAIRSLKIAPAEAVQIYRQIRVDSMTKRRIKSKHGDALDFIRRIAYGLRLDIPFDKAIETLKQEPIGQE